MIFVQNNIMYRIVKYIFISVIFISCAPFHHIHNGSPSHSAGSKNELTGSYVFINQVPFEVKGDLDEVLNKELPKYEGKTVYVELNTTEYTVSKTIKLPSKIRSRVIIEGNYANIISKLPKEDFLFYKKANYDHGLMTSADTYQEISNLYIKGSGGAVFLQGGFQSACRNIFTQNQNRGIKFEFILHGVIEDCHFLHVREYAIHMNNIPGKSLSQTPCNQSVVKGCRVMAHKMDVGFYFGNSNNVTLTNNIIEGQEINTGIHVHNASTTVANFSILDTHFENSKYHNSCILLTGKLRQLLIERMYYSGIAGLAIKSEAGAYSHIHLRDIGYADTWKLETSIHPKLNNTNSTWWYLENVRYNTLEKLFPGRKPFYLYDNGRRKTWDD